METENAEHNKSEWGVCYARIRSKPNAIQINSSSSRCALCSALFAHEEEKIWLNNEAKKPARRKKQEMTRETTDDSDLKLWTLIPLFTAQY